MVSDYTSAERRVLAALLLDWHRPGDHLLGPDDLRDTYSLDINPKLFDAVAADLQRRGIAKVFFAKEGGCAILEDSGYKEARQRCQVNSAEA